jgi:hypothetical protein
VVVLADAGSRWYKGHLPQFATFTECSAEEVLVMKRLLNGALLFTAVMLIPGWSEAADRLCADEIITYPAVIQGNLVVVKPPVGLGVCRVLGVEVKGNVIVRDNGIVILDVCRASNADPNCPNPGPAARTQVFGNVISDGAPRTIRIGGATRVYGNVMVKYTQGVGAAVNLICAAEIYGSLQVMANGVGTGIGGFGAAPPSGGCGTSGPNVYKHLLVTDNAAQVDISDTTVMGQVQCTNNVLPPVNYGGNSFAGLPKGQCAGFAP